MLTLLKTPDPSTYSSVLGKNKENEGSKDSPTGSQLQSRTVGNGSLATNGDSAQGRKMKSKSKGVLLQMVARRKVKLRRRKTK
jgi:hypothetical protein